MKMNISEKLIMVYIKFYLIHTRVGWSKFFKNSLNNEPFCVIHRIQARLVVGFHKINGVSLCLSKKLTFVQNR